MPPQQSDIPCEIARDGARFRADPSIVSQLFRRCWRAVVLLRPRSGVTLQELNDRELKDIGLTRSDVDNIRPERAIEALRHRAADLLNRGGM